MVGGVNTEEGIFLPLCLLSFPGAPTTMEHFTRMTHTSLATPAEQAAMARARELASRGPRTGPNPQVGCVLLTPDGVTVSEGWHEGAGTPHAEVMALETARQQGQDTSGLTAVVTLEPCAHTGRTGPCAEALIEAGIARVVYAVSDPGVESAGGARLLEEAGIEVVDGVQSDDGLKLIERWHTATKRQRPWVTTKWAMSLDGRTAAADGTSQWITSPHTREKIHTDRADHDVIVVGTTTVLVDNPSLTARTSEGELLPAQPRAVVVGERDVPDGSKVFEHPEGFSHHKTRDVKKVLSDLFDDGVRSVYLEGGPTLVSSFIENELIDEFHITMGSLLLGGPKTATTNIGVQTIAGARNLTISDTYQLDDDVIVIARPQKKED